MLSYPRTTKIIAIVLLSLLVIVVILLFVLVPREGMTFSTPPTPPPEPPSGIARCTYGAYTPILTCSYQAFKNTGNDVEADS